MRRYLWLPMLTAITLLGLLVAQDRIPVPLGENAAAPSPNTSLEESEILSVSNTPVTFRSFQAKQMKRNPEELIMNIGRDLARECARFGRGGKAARYSIERFPGSEDRLGADLIMLGPEAKMNHIVNVRRLVHGYLAEMHGYGYTRGRAIAWFILVYNAVHRGNTAYLKAAFVPALAERIPPGLVGIDTNYENWPGKTFIVIPLRRQGKNVVGISAAEIGRETAAAVAAMGGHYAERQEMIAERETQLSNEMKSLAAEAAQLEREAEKVAAERKAADMQAVAAVTAEEKAAAAKKLAEVAEKEAALEKKQEAYEDKVMKAAAEEAAIAEEKKRIEQEKFTAAATAAAVAENKAREEASRGNVSLGLVFFLKTIGFTGAHLNQQLYVINPADDTAQAIALPKVSGRYLSLIDGDPLVFMYEDPQSLNLTLARIDRTTYQVKARGKEPVFAGSRIWQQNGFIYVIGQEGTKNFLYRYDGNCNLVAKSTVEIFNDTEITFTKGKLYCTRMSGPKTSAILVLKEDDLKLLKTIE